MIKWARTTRDRIRRIPIPEITQEDVKMIEMCDAVEKRMVFRAVMELTPMDEPVTIKNQ